jgi:hypothetical protein
VAWAHLNLSLTCPERIRQNFLNEFALMVHIVFRIALLGLILLKVAVSRFRLLGLESVGLVFEVAHIHVHCQWVGVVKMCPSRMANNSA